MPTSSSARDDRPARSAGPVGPLARGRAAASGRPPGSGRRLLAVATVIAVAALLPAVGPAAATGAPPTAPQGGAPLTAAGAAKSAKAHRVTLITGDRVTVTTGADGRQSATVDPAPGNPKSFQTVTGPDGDLYVYPLSVLSGLGTKTLDKRLFDVTRLIEDGHGDGAADEALPVIVSYDDKPSRSTLSERADRLPGSAPKRVLDRLDMAALRVRASGAASFWKAARPREARAEGARSAGSGVAKIWYDAPVKASLDKSVPQIHAPEAWAEGYDGTGTTVAVLDTGIDLNHADVKDRVLATKSFVGTATVQDGHGHGTHVASTIAGSGAESGGRYKGVAPGAKLLVGKVLGDTGSGDDSGVIAGMEWAVEQGADIVSMSLGDDAGTADDPTSQAVQRLSASSDALFVVAAGNTGPGASTVGSPGAAPAALTVGAVDSSDALADFSSRGPVGDAYAIKPDVTAPGVDIVAARAAGTAMGTPVDAHYTSASGTSMATPHVAGAAAILAQRHPGWSGERLKAELTSHTEPSSAYSVQEQGNGRIDVAASLHASVDLSGPLDFGMIRFERTGQTYEKLRRTLTVSNPTDAATTVRLAAHTSAGTLTDGALTFGESEVTVPAGGSVDVPVTLDPNALAAASYSGQVTAVAASGATATAALGFTKEGEAYGMSVGLKDRRDTAPENGLVVVMGLDSDYYETFPLAGKSRLDLRMPKGSYALFGGLTTGDLGFRGGYGDATDLFSLPDVTVSDEPVSVTVDATKAKDVRLDVAGDSRERIASSYAYGLRRTAPDGRGAGVSLIGDASFTTGHFGAIPSRAPALGTLATSLYHRERSPLLTVETGGRKGVTLLPRTDENFARFEGDRTLTLVDVGTGSPAELAAKDVKGKAVLLRDDAVDVGADRANRLEEAGVAAVLHAPVSERTVYAVMGEGARVPFAELDRAGGAKLRERLAAAGRGGLRVTLHGAEESAFSYGGQWDFDAIPSDLALHVRKGDFAKVTNRFHGYGAEQDGSYQQDAWNKAGEPLAARVPERVRRGHQREDYVYARTGTTYQQQVGATRYAAATHGRVAAYRPGSSVTEDWFAPALHPAPKGSYFSCNFCVTEQGIAPLPGTAGDSDPEHYADFSVLGTIGIHRDGVRVPDTTPIDRKADYRIDLDMPYTARDGLADASSHTAYSFTADVPTGVNEETCADLTGAAVCQPLPVILPHYTLATDLLNRVRAGEKFSFTLDGYRAKGWHGTRKVTGAKVSLSYDGGRTWKNADVRRLDGDSFKVSATQPKLSRTDGHVSLRAELRDAAGTRTVETVERAYGLK